MRKSKRRRKKRELERGEWRVRGGAGERERQEYYNVAELPLKNKKSLMGNISNISNSI